MTHPQAEQIEQIELDLILGAIRMRYGYDFSQYAQESLRERIKGVQQEFGANHLSELVPKLLWNTRLFDRLLRRILVGTTEFFRDPCVFVSLSRNVLPKLRTLPSLKVWLAGCGSGEEVYSLMILLDAEQLLDRCVIYATDIDNQSLDQAKAGIYPANVISKAEDNLRQIAPSIDLQKYVHASCGNFRVADSMRERVTFSHHNLACDDAFGEMHLVLCRNVIIYFEQTLEQRVLDLMARSIYPGGFLCLGRSESLTDPETQAGFDYIDLANRIYRKRQDQKTEAA